MLYNNTNHTHTHTTHTQHQNEGMDRAVKNSLEIIIKQVRLEGGIEREGRIRVPAKTAQGPQFSFPVEV